MGSLPQSNRIGPVDILADTQGVDFGPYISRLITTVRRNWIGMLPESVKAPFFDSGDVLIEFTITPNGRFQDIAIARGSGKIQMDRAALASITVTNTSDVSVQVRIALVAQSLKVE